MLDLSRSQPRDALRSRHVACRFQLAYPFGAREGALDTMSEGFRAWLHEAVLSEAVPGLNVFINMALPWHLLFSFPALPVA